MLTPAGTADAHYTLASRHPPYNVYGTPWSIPGASLVSDCGDVISVDHTGALSRVTQTFRYANGSAIHGHAIDKGQEYLYSADLRGDKIWAHQVYANGYVKEIGAMGTTAGANPRHLATHPGGKYIYAVLEHANELAEYKLDPTTRLPVAESVRTWGLAPEGMYVPTPRGGEADRRTQSPTVRSGLMRYA
jgi:carboxy-cis,cis-muconate cyclase